MVFDYVYDKRNNGTWIPWAELEKEVPIPANAKVTIAFTKHMCHIVFCVGRDHS